MRIDHAHAIKLVILGRDGTLNEYRDDHVKDPDELTAIPGALEALARLNHAGWHTVLATNQPGIARGLFDMVSLNAVHLRLNQMLADKGGRVAAAFFCPHGPEDGCDCRKPLPGLIEQIGDRFGVDLGQVHMVGASMTDLKTAFAAGCVPHLVLSGQLGRLTEEQLTEQVAQVPGAQVHADLAAFADDLIHRERRARADARGEVLTPPTEPGGLN